MTFSEVPMDFGTFSERAMDFSKGEHDCSGAFVLIPFRGSDGNPIDENSTVTPGSGINEKDMVDCEGQFQMNKRSLQW